jgi:hypothetical protein
MRRPRRVKVQGDYYHGVVPVGAKYVGRSAPGKKASPYANRFTVKRYGDQAVPLYVAYLLQHPMLLDQARRDLAGFDLACWCPLPAPGQPDGCHGWPLLVLVNPGLFAEGLQV